MSRLDATTGRPRWAGALAWGLFGLFVLISFATVGLAMKPATDRGEAIVVLSVGYAAVGALVAWREPRNAIGWLMLTTAICVVMTSFSLLYVQLSGRPGAVAVAWINSWLDNVWLGLTALVLPLVFPAGRLLSKRWRLALWTAGGTLALSILSDGFMSGPLDVNSDVTIVNPLGVSGPMAALVEAAGLLSQVLFPIALGIGVLSLVLRLRRSHGRERQQVKWFAYVGGLSSSALALSSATALVGTANDGALRAWSDIVSSVGWFSALVLIVFGLPAAIGTAMLRHRLYDIDLVIKRTLVYGALTLLLVSVYLGLVLGLRSLLNPLTGESDLAVAASTLAVAALFRPLRTRIQNLVDRRFYRQRYDATQAITAFTAQLRQEVDLDTVTTDLLGVVRDTLQPKHATLWLRGAPQVGRQP